MTSGWDAGARATVHGAVSIVNAIATKRGATLGVSLSVEAELRARRARAGGISITSADGSRSLSSKLVQETVRHAVPKKTLRSHKIDIAISSEIPAGFGLKSSSAISSAVALACSKAFGLGLSDRQVLLAGVEASIASKVSMTGAYDDACSCYYGGFNVTDNAARRTVRHQRAPDGMSAVIFIPRNRRRGNIKKLRHMGPVFEVAWNLARKTEYWKAMTINGLAVASVLGSDAGLVANLAEKGALAASVSGNGPSIAAIARDDSVQSVKKAFANSSIEGRATIVALNNRKADVHDIL